VGVLVRHVRAEVVLDVSHTPAGQLVLGQVQAEAAQLEHGCLGFRSLYVLSIHEEEYRLGGVVQHHSSLVLAAHSVHELLLVISVMKFKLGLNRPEGFVIGPFPSGEQETDDLLDVIAWPQNEVHLLCATDHIPAH